MSTADALGRSVKCPYYINTDSQVAMVCEGFNEHCRCNLTFLGHSSYAKWRRQYCAGAYRKCPLYIALTQHKYNFI